MIGINISLLICVDGMKFPYILRNINSYVNVIDIIYAENTNPQIHFVQCLFLVMDLNVGLNAEKGQTKNRREPIFS